MSRDIDLQAILDAPDSDSSDFESDVIDELPLFQKGFYRSTASNDKTNSLQLSNNSHDANPNASGNGNFKGKHVSGKKNYYETNVDLEKLLMEHDYDEDDEECGDGFDELNVGNEHYSPEKLLRTFDLNNSNDDNFSLGASTIPTLPSQFVMNTHKSPVHMKTLHSNGHGNADLSGTSTRGDAHLISNDAFHTSHKRNNSSNNAEDTFTQGYKGGDNNVVRSIASSPDKSEVLSEASSPSKLMKKTLVYDMPRLSKSITNNNDSKDTRMARRKRTAFREDKSKETNNYAYGSSHRHPEEWAVLQSILNDEDENETSFGLIDYAGSFHRGSLIEGSEEIVPVHSTSSSNPNCDLIRRKIYRAESNTSSTIDIDAILYSMDDDSDDDANLAELDEMISKFSIDDRLIQKKMSTPNKNVLLENKDVMKQAFSCLPPVVDRQPGTKQTISKTMEQQQENHNKPEPKVHLEVILSSVKKEGKYRHQHNTSSLSISDSLTEAALKHAEDYERRLLKPGHRDIVSPLMVKRRMKPKIELETKSRKQQLHNHQPQKKKGGNQFSQQNQGFNFSGMIEFKSKQRISSELIQCAQSHKETIGLPTALSIGSKFIAIGTQCGIILVFDLFEELRQQLGILPNSGNNDVASTSVQKYGSVSSIDLSANGENLVAGYTSGCIALWDVIKGTVVKSVPDMHPSPITSLRFISEKTLTLVSADAGGVLNKISFSKPLLWTTFTVDNECLLDGTAGQILSFTILPQIPPEVLVNNTEDKRQSFHQSVGDMVLIALSSARSSFAIAVEPKVSVLHKWAKPSVEQMNIAHFMPTKDDTGTDEESKDGKQQSKPQEIFLPCLAWNWVFVSGGGNRVTPILARAWGCCIQFLQASFPSSEDSEKTDESVQWPAFGDHDEFQSTAPVVAMEWLGNRSLVYLTLTNEMSIIDTVMMTISERLDFSGLKLVYAEFALSRSVPGLTTTAQEAGTIASTSFQNSIRSNDDRVLVLCQEELKYVSIIGIQKRIRTLEEDGEWLEALALALDYYDSTIRSLEDRRRDPDRDNIMDHPEFVSRIRKSADEEWIAELLLRYLNLAVENAPESNLSPSVSFGRTSDRQSRIDLAQSHFQMLAGVCIEFCIVTRRLDLLFNDVYDRFRGSGYTIVFLDVLEPYVLNEKLQYIAPEVMAQFIEHCKITNDVATVERCLLHMDVTIMDFDSILSLLRKNGMYSALIHVYTHGLDDFVSPLETLFEAIFDSTSKEICKSRRLDGLPQTTFEKYGYKAILYLRHCFTNRSFPQGQELKPEGRVEALRPELLKYLKRKTYISPSRRHHSLINNDIRQSYYPYVKALMMVDAKAFLDVLSLVFDAPDARFVESVDIQVSMEAWHNVVLKAEEQKYSNDEEMEVDKIMCPDRMDFARILSLILTSLESVDTTFGNVDQYQVTKNAFYDFMAKYLIKGLLRAPPSLIMLVLTRLASISAQDDIIKLLQVLPRNSFDRERALRVVESEGMTRAALVLYKTGVVDLFEGTCTNEVGAHYFIKSIECYLKDKEVKFKLGAFDFVKKECIGGSTFRTDGDEKTVHDVLRNSLCQKLNALVNLDPILTAQIVAEIYIEELDTILKALQVAEEGMALFKFFHAVISGDLTKLDVVAGPVLLAHLTIDHHQQYLELMARFHPEMVYHHLITHDNYRTEECLQLCQVHEIADASAYLLERMGNVSSALQLMLQTLEGRLMTLKRVVRGLSTSSSYSFPGRKLIKRSRGRKPTSSPYHDSKEAQSVRQILTVALDLCERNSSSSSNKTGHGSQLWFNVLDRLINAKGFLRLSKELPEHSEIMLSVLSDLLRMTMQRMVSNVALPDLVRKITTDHAGNRLGEFRDMISTMLSTYASELEICSSAVEVMNNDVFHLMSIKFSLKMSGVKVNNILGKALYRNDDNTLNNDYLSNGSILSVKTGNATFLRNQDFNKTRQNTESSSHLALNRLRSKRQRQRNQSRKICQGKKSEFDIGMMTMSDKMYANGESSDAAFMPRFVGGLSTAEHYGRIVNY